MVSKINWDDAHYAIRTTLTDLRQDKARHKMLAAMRDLNAYEYAAALLTRAAQESIDFTFQQKHDWQAVYKILRGVCKDYKEGSRENWIADARRSKLSLDNYFCAKLTRYVAEVIDFEDFLSSNDSSFAVR